MGCHKFCNYKHLLQVSRDGKWMEGGEFPASLGSYATIHESNSGGTTGHCKYKHLDVVHMDIAFSNRLFVGGFRYALILVDGATWYNWAFWSQESLIGHHPCHNLVVLCCECLFL
jgi:hypothetical protein